VFSYQLGTELPDYGAMLALMGVNFASILRGWRQGRGAQSFPVLLSFGGLVTCFFSWINLGTLARIVGTVGACVGILLW